jgi:hypothetical protein
MKADQKTQLQPPSEVSKKLTVEPFHPLAQHQAQAARASAVPGVGRLAPRPKIASGTASTPTPIARIAPRGASTAEVATLRTDVEALGLRSIRNEPHDDRAEVPSASPLRLDKKERLVELLTSELVSAFEDGWTEAANDIITRPPTGDRRGATPQSATSSPSSASRAQAADRAAEAVALAEKIERFARAAGAPALHLTLDNALGARIEVERLAPSEVTVKLIGRRGPPSPDAVSRVREELKSRGLRVAAMSVA